MMFAVIKILIIFCLLIYTGYFRGWNGWCMVPLTVLFAVIVCIDGASPYGLAHVSGWILKPVEIIVFWIPTATMAFTGKEGRKGFAIYCEAAWAWIQDKRQ